MPAVSWNSVDVSAPSSHRATPLSVVSTAGTGDTLVAAEVSVVPEANVAVTRIVYV